jgi:hypothetical protein
MGPEKAEAGKGAIGQPCGNRRVMPAGFEEYGEETVRHTLLGICCVAVFYVIVEQIDNFFPIALRKGGKRALR